MSQVPTKRQHFSVFESQQLISVQILRGIAQINRTADAARLTMDQ